MNGRDFYSQLVDKMYEITLVPPARCGPLTGLYRGMTARLKQSPWIPAGFLSVFGAAGLYILFGSAFVHLASVLQYGF